MNNSPLSKEQWQRLCLIRSRNIGPATYYQLLERHQSAETAVRWLRQHKHDRISITEPSALEAEVRQLHRVGGQLLWHDDAQYPPLLKHIPHAPPVLTAIGDPEILNAPAVAIVGARNASHSGLYMAEKLAKDLSSRGIVIVSGMARGIDAVAHQASQRSDQSRGTIAVLAGGLDKPFPPENIPLYQNLCDGGGLVISEMPLGTEPQSRLFPRRNRIIAGLVRLCVIIEASAQSGSMITASLAADYGREVGAVPGSPLDSRNTGSLNLLRQGAHVISSAQDICDILDDMEHTLITEDAKTIAVTSIPFDEQQCDDAQRTLLELLGTEPCAVDHLIQSLPYSPALILSCLCELELNGEVIRHWDNRVIRLFSGAETAEESFLDATALERQEIEDQARLFAAKPRP